MLAATGIAGYKSEYELFNVEVSTYDHLSELLTLKLNGSPFWITPLLANQDRLAELYRLDLDDISEFRVESP